MARYRSRDAERGGRSKSGHRQLDAHGQGKLMTCEPAYHRLGDSDACHLIAYTEDGKAKTGNRYRHG